jgi:hypothetical protein
LAERLEPVVPSQPYRITIGPAVQALLDTRARLGTAYGAEDEQVIAEDSLGGHGLQVTLRHDERGWTLTVRATPALRASVLFTAEERSWRQTFDERGEVSFGGLEEAWLRTGFDLHVELVPEP